MRDDLVGLAYDEVSATLDMNVAGAGLYTVDVETGQATLVGENGVNNIEGLAWLAVGAARACRDVSEIHIVLKIFCGIRDTRKAAVRNWSPRLLGALAGKDAETRLQALGIEYDIAPLKPAFLEAQTMIRRLGPSSHIVDWEAAEEIAEVIPYELQEAMGDAVAILGDPDQVTKRFKELEGLGIDHVYIYYAEAVRLPEPELRAFKEVIGPALSSSTAEVA